MNNKIIFFIDILIFLFILILMYSLNQCYNKKIPYCNETYTKGELKKDVPVCIIELD